MSGLVPDAQNVVGVGKRIDEVAWRAACGRVKCVRRVLSSRDSNVGPYVSEMWGVSGTGPGLSSLMST